MAATPPEFEVFRQYLKANGLKQTLHRKLILRTFLAGEGHRTVEDIYRAVSGEEPRIGYTTVYRTMKLLSESGLAREVELADGVTRYEHLYNHSHHDHLICTECGDSIEFLNPEIEQVQEAASARMGFKVLDHRLQIYGLCKRCRD
jgi:Fur family ferric uptake transcriptional regulator